MYKIILLLFFFIPLQTFSDPFYGDNEKQDNAQAKSNFVKKRERMTACEIPENANEINLPIEFEDLKFIGIFKNQNKFKALFVDKNNQIFDFSSNDFLKERAIQISEISIKSVKYINWDLTEDCQSPYQITLKI